MARKGPSHQQPAEVALPITPFLDMAFQLMFFFITTFALNPQGLSAEEEKKIKEEEKKREGQMDINLPSKDSAKAAKAPSEVDPLSAADKEEVKIESDVTVSIKGKNNAIDRGKIDVVTITGPAGEEELPRPSDELVATLKSRLEAIKTQSAEKIDKKEDKTPIVKMTADSIVQWAEVVRIMDICYKSGFQVSFARPIDQGQN